MLNRVHLVCYYVYFITHSIPESHLFKRFGMPMQLFTLLYANAIDTTPLMRSGLNNGAQGHTFHWATYSIENALPFLDLNNKYVTTHMERSRYIAYLYMCSTNNLPLLYIQCIHANIEKQKHLTYE